MEISGQKVLNFGRLTSIWFYAN